MDDLLWTPIRLFNVSLEIGIEPEFASCKGEHIIHWTTKWDLKLVQIICKCFAIGILNACIVPNIAFSVLKLKIKNGETSPYITDM